jgi:hypothetical protein
MRLWTAESGFESLPPSQSRFLPPTPSVSVVSAAWPGVKKAEVAPRRTARRWRTPAIPRREPCEGPWSQADRHRSPARRALSAESEPGCRASAGGAVGRAVGRSERARSADRHRPRSDCSTRALDLAGQLVLGIAHGRNPGLAQHLKKPLHWKLRQLSRLRERSLPGLEEMHCQRAMNADCKETFIEGDGQDGRPPCLVMIDRRPSSASRIRSPVRLRRSRTVKTSKGSVMAGPP